MTNQDHRPPGVSNPAPDIIQAFGTPIFIAQPEMANAAFNQRLQALVLEKEKQASSENYPISNIGGWQSDRDLLQWDDPAIKQLLNLFLYAFGRMTAGYLNLPAEKLNARFDLTAWANVIRHGAYNAPHKHIAMGSTWSAVYYVAAGDIEEDKSSPAGKLQLEDPRSNTYLSGLGNLSSKPLLITPEAGRLVIFPSWLLHMVHPYQGESVRISIACNGKLLEHELLE